MLYNLDEKLSEKDISVLQEYYGLYNFYILKKANFKCYVYVALGKGKYSYMECFGAPEPAACAYYQESTYDLVIPNKIIFVSSDRCYVEIKGESNIWYRGGKGINGNIELLYRKITLRMEFNRYN